MYAAADFFSCGLLVLDAQWELINTCSFYTALGNNPVKEELCPLVALSLEKIAKAPHETQEHHVFCGERICKIIQPDGLLNATSPCSH